MQLIGQFDSPFVRRVGIALTWYGMPFTQLPLSVFGDADALATYSPLRRVPTLVLDDSIVLTEAFVCLDTVDQLAVETHGEGWSKLLVPTTGIERRTVLRRCGFASGTTDKVVSLVYEEKIREQRSSRWTARCILQITDTLRMLERETDANFDPSKLSHADIAVTCLLTFMSEAQPELLSLVDTPKLHRLQATCEQRSEFQAVFAPFTVAAEPGTPTVAQTPTPPLRT
jgi:glutathione S-transferase